MTLLWRAAMSIDGGVIDQDHQLLLAIVSEFLDIVPSIGGKAELQRTLARLHHHTNTHLEREERLQAAIRFPELKGHHEAHKGLIARLDAITEKVAKLETRLIEVVREGAQSNELAFVGKEEAERFIHAHDEIRGLLKTWLVEHILKADLKMKPYVEAMRPYSEKMPPLWKAEAARLAPNLDTSPAASNAFQTARSWMPAGFRKDKIELTSAIWKKFDRPTVKSINEENRIIERMRRQAVRLGMQLEFDPHCHNVKDTLLKHALAALRASGESQTDDKAAAQQAFGDFAEYTALFKRIGPNLAAQDYVIRRAGAKFLELFAIVPDRPMSDLLPVDRLATWLMLMDGALELGSPLRVEGDVVLPGRGKTHIESLLAPFYDYAANTAEILVVVSDQLDAHASRPRAVQ